MADKDIRRWTWTKLQDSAYDALLRASTELGKHPSDVLAEAFDAWCIEFAKKSKNKSVTFHNAHTKDRERQTQLSIVKQLIVSYQKHPTDEAFDEITNLCDLIGETMDSLSDELKETPHISEILKSSDKVSKAEMWILEFMKPDKPVASNVIKEKADKAGFADYIIDRAKERLNRSGSVDITAFRQGSMWFWRMTVPDQSN